ncbi:hypothetical protein [Oceaniferula marina]|nr:hypothetical protein [Oceaniferula marina]
MFDTVYFDQRLESLGEHDDWYVTLRKPLKAEDGDGSPQFISAKHKDTKITLSGSLDEGFTKVKVPSLASLLHGQNGQPLEGPQEVAAAFDVLEGLLAMVSKPDGPRSFTRVDIALNLNIKYRDIEYGLWGSALKQGRKTPMIYPRESITFRRAATELKFYDKAIRTQAKDVPGAASLQSFVRVELSLKGEDLKDAFTGGALPVTGLDYMKSYEVLREHVLEVAPATKAIQVTDTDSYLAWLYRQDPSLLMPYIEREGKGKSPSRRKKMREVARMATTIGENEIPWSDVMPKDRPPVQIQLFYPNEIKDVFHPGIATHPVSEGLLISSDGNETVLQRLVRNARYRCGLGKDRWGKIKPIEVDSHRLGASDYSD